MSANNQLVISRQGDKWEIANVDVDTYCAFIEGNADTLDEAIDIANKIIETEYVEYGMRIIR
jgi:hypothetical protein